MKKIIVVGGGPAGLIAAGMAAKAGASVTILEKMKKPGRKLCITGKGRCNITNVAEMGDFLAHFSKSGSFLRQSFYKFFNTELIAFLENLGLELVTERGGRVFPASSKAVDVLKVLLRWLEKLGVSIQNATKVNNIVIEDGCVKGVVMGNSRISCDAVILATGGASYPATGSTGDGYKLASMAGHKIVPVRPALVPLETDGDIAARLAGLNLRNVGVRMFVDGKKKQQAFGEMVFSDFGVTGPVILTLSTHAVDYLLAGKTVSLVLDLKPALDDKKLDLRLQRDFTTRGKEAMKSVLRALMPRELVRVCLEESGIAPERLANTITKLERRALRSWLKDFRLQVTGYRSFDEAIVTAGGVQTKHIDPNTMESKLTKGLFIVGELLDIQANTGGYNLQAAFSTGNAAGIAAAAPEKENSKDSQSTPRG